MYVEGNFWPDRVTRHTKKKQYFRAWLLRPLRSVLLRFDNSRNRYCSFVTIFRFILVTENCVALLWHVVINIKSSVVTKEFDDAHFMNNLTSYVNIIIQIKNGKTIEFKYTSVEVNNIEISIISVLFREININWLNFISFVIIYIVIINSRILCFKNDREMSRVRL